MHEFHGQATAQVDAPPREVFDLITDLDKLSEWNSAIKALVERPPVLAEGAEWTVRMHPPRAPSWGSISHVEQLDRPNLRFSYRTRNTDGNPSYVTWAWQISAADGGSEVTVSWDCYLKTLDRRLLAGPLRKRGLAREVPRSLAAIASVVRAAQPA